VLADWSRRAGALGVAVDGQATANGFGRRRRGAGRDGAQRAVRGSKMNLETTAGAFPWLSMGRYGAMMLGARLGPASTAPEWRGQPPASGLSLLCTSPYTASTIGAFDKLRTTGQQHSFWVPACSRFRLRVDAATTIASLRPHHQFSRQLRTAAPRGASGPGGGPRRGVLASASCPASSPGCDPEIA